MFSVELYEVEPNSNLVVRAKEVKVPTINGIEKRVEIFLYCDPKNPEDPENPEVPEEDTYDERKCKTKAEIAMMVVGSTAKVVGAGAAVAGVAFDASGVMAGEVLDAGGVEAGDVEMKQPEGEEQDKP